MNPAILKIDRVSKYFNTSLVLNQMSLAVEAGSITGLVGPNGAGKTTLFKLVVGLLQKCQGQIFFKGQVINTLSIDQRTRLGIGYISQEPLFFRTFSVRNNILAMLELMKVPKKGIAEECQLILEKTRLTEVASQIAYQLSGGQKRRLELARIFIYRPSLILIDEPFTGVDPIGIRDFKENISDLQAQGITIFISDQNISHILSIIQGIHLIDKGAIIFSGTPAEFTANGEVKSRYLGEY